MNKNYNLKLDLQFRCNNSIMTFNEFDNNTSDFFIRITNSGKLVDIEKAIVVLAVIKPSGKVASQFVEVKNGLVYADLKPNMVDEIGTYTAQAMLILEDERVVTDTISYEVKEDKIFSLLNDTVETAEDFTLLTDMLNRLSTIEISEEQRVINEAERILSEENRKIEESKRIEAELIRQHEEADRAKYDATRESNENIRKQNESTRLANETNRIDEEAKRVEEENKRKLAEEERNANYNFMTEDEERRRLEANAHKEAEKLRAQAENTRVNEEAKRRTTEQARVSAENTRVSNENTRKANETTRQTNETHRVEAETQRQNRYNSFIADAEANANNFENYTNTAKVKEEERKSNELDRKSQEDRRVSNEVERISNENTRKANEVAREKNETTRQNTFANKVNEVDKKIIEINTTKDNFVSSINTKVDNKISEIEVAKSDMTNTVSNKVNEVETRFNALTSSQQQDAEVIDARDGEISLKARLDRDIEKAKQVYVNVEGSHISTDSSVGYAKDIEILGNTVQDASNLADIRSVGDKVEGQELYEIPVLSCGKNLFDKENFTEFSNSTKQIKVLPNTTYYVYTTNTMSNGALVWLHEYDKDGNKITNGTTIWSSGAFTTKAKTTKVHFNSSVAFIDTFVLSTEPITEYEPYQEDKLTILSPTPLEKVGDVADRIIEKDGVWGVEKNVATITFNGEEIWSYDTFTKGYYTFLPNLVADATIPITNRYLGVPDIKGIGQCHLGGTEGNKNGNLVINHDDGVIGTTAFREYVTSNNITVKYPTTQPQFIPLPHSQQVKLRTFANKTNISFLTEIEGTIKAQVPKSIGATVNTHTEQINNLNKELDRVKKLEESTVSTVTTENDFTTVEATSNGYFEDVKLEGKTLVNLFKNVNWVENVSSYIYTENVLYNPVGETVTFINLSNKQIEFAINDSDVLGIHGNYVDSIYIDAFSTKVIKIPNGCGIRRIVAKYKDGWTADDITTIKNKTILLKGAYPNICGPYFEGLKSVGQDVDEVSIESVNENLFDVDKIVSNYSEYFKCNEYIKYQNGGSYTYLKQDFEPNTQYSFTIKASSSKPTNLDFTCRYTDGTYSRFTINNNTTDTIYTKSFISDKNKSIKSFGSFYSDNSLITVYFDGTCINKGTTPKPYTPYQSDKKRLLYYNEETQTWEKPILHEWDSIEKHTDGKYYYHVRSIEEDYVEGDESVSNYITDMTTTVKPLSQEKVYECTNIDLITYANETNFIVESGAITPKITLKVHNNISNVVSLLQKKVSLLESNVTSYMITQNRLMLASRYNADTVSFKVDVASFSDTFEYDNDLYELILNNILVGKNNYNREYIENLTRFYWMDFVISDEMYSTLFEIIEEQHNPKVLEETPLI